MHNTRQIQQESWSKTSRKKPVEVSQFAMCAIKNMKCHTLCWRHFQSLTWIQTKRNNSFKHYDFLAWKEVTSSALCSDLSFSFQPGTWTHRQTVNGSGLHKENHASVLHTNTALVLCVFFLRTAIRFTILSGTFVSLSETGLPITQVSHCEIVKHGQKQQTNHTTPPRKKEKQDLSPPQADKLFLPPWSES